MNTIDTKIVNLENFLINYLTEQNIEGLHIIIKETMENQFLFTKYIGKAEDGIDEINVNKFEVAEHIFAETSFKKPHMPLYGIFYIKNGNQEYLCSVHGANEKKNYEACIEALSFLSKKTKEQIFQSTPNWVLEHFVPK